MSLNTTGPAPIVIVKFGGQSTTGQCYLSFQAEPLDSAAQSIGEFSTDIANNQLVLKPQDLLDPPNNSVADLIGCYVGWSVFFYSFVGVDPSFEFSLKLQQSGNDLITPVVITQDSTEVVAAKGPDGDNNIVFSFGNFGKIV
jgi:hypothetical protein